MTSKLQVAYLRLQSAQRALQNAQMRGDAAEIASLQAIVNDRQNEYNWTVIEVQREAMQAAQDAH